MSDIFISYRRGSESWVARALNEHLENDFDVYLDTRREANDLGDNFDRTINDALASCRVVFVIIGASWLESIPRLTNPKDWVRYELLAALARGDDVRVVPLFVAPHNAPDWTLLPAELQSLGLKNGRSLNSDSWESESTELVTRLKQWLTVPRGVAMPSAPFPQVLPFLCDRRDQEDDLVDMVQRYPLTAPLACVVHGHKWAAHDGFLDRLAYQGALEDILRAAETGVDRLALQLSRDRMRDGRHREALMSALKVALLNRRTTTDADLRARLLKLPKPLVAVAQLTWSDIDTSGRDIVEKLVAAWSGLLLPEDGGAVLPLPFPAVLWINVTYDDVETELSRETLVVPLRKLPPIEAGHIREWLGLDEVRHRAGSRQQDIEDLSDNGDYCFSPGKLHMRRFADGVRDILSAG
jgi:hypothetical protein